jgi:two-component system, NtrC family, C4-dicarboxylate transport response regulator DctD
MKTLSSAVILVDDEEEVRASIGQTLELAGYQVAPFADAATALPHITADWPGVVVSDVKMPRVDGLAFLRLVLERDPELPFIIVTAHGDIPMAVQATRLGAYDFFEKTGDPEVLLGTIERAMDKRRLVLENRALRRELESRDHLEGRLIGRSAAMAELRRTVGALAGVDVDVLIEGETGSGKDLVARCLHDFGARGNRPFVAINCGALPREVVESELFGHEAGSFTGAARRRIGKIEYAEGGTLFLDEIESMAFDLQVRLLRTLQERTIDRLGRNAPIPVDIRVVAATKVDLRQAVAAGSFRQDLFYRLNVARLRVPPLREREEDILLLFGHFLKAAAERYRKSPVEVDSALHDRLVTAPWPGNVRELRNAADRLILGMPVFDEPTAAEGRHHPLGERLDLFEKTVITEELRRQAGQIGLTAQALGIPRKTLYLRMQKHGLNREDYRDGGDSFDPSAAPS